MKKPDAYSLYLGLEFIRSTLFSMVFVVTSLYEVTVAGLDPLQLVLVGTTLELSVMLFEIPTGVVADVYSRRLSIVIGYVLIGGGFLIEGLFPSFIPILLAQICWGLGYTFTSGAEEAWLSDEIGEGPANKAFLRANQFGLAGALAGMLLAVPVGDVRVNLPIVAGGILVILTAIVLAVLMPEQGFVRPARPGNRNPLQPMLDTFLKGVRTVRGRPALTAVLGVGLIYGLYSEGFDRLWVKHVLDGFSLPPVLGLNQVAWFSGLRVVSMLLSIAATRLVEKRINPARPAAIARALFAVTAVLSVGILTFALSPALALTCTAYWLVAVSRNVIGPLYTAWVNQRLDPAVRATIISMSGQADAIGQIAGGPVIGVIANSFSVRAAISLSGLLLTPALPLIGRASRLHAAAEAGIDPDGLPAG